MREEAQSVIVELAAYQTCESVVTTAAWRACVLKRMGKLPEQPKRKTYAFFKRQGFTMECVQTDNGFEFTNHFSNSKQELQTLFEKAVAELGIRHNLNRLYTPRHPQT